MFKFQQLFIFISLILCTALSVQAQELMKVNDGYQRGDLHISEHRIGAYYQEFDSIAYYKYKKQMSSKNMSSSVAKLSAILAGTGILLALYSQKGNNNADPRVNTAFIAGLVMFNVGAPLFIISAPIALYQSNKSDEALKYFNNNPDNFSYKKDSSYLQLGVTGNGVGLVLTF